MYRDVQFTERTRRGLRKMSVGALSAQAISKSLELAQRTARGPEVLVKLDGIVPISPYLRQNIG